METPQGKHIQLQDKPFSPLMLKFNFAVFTQLSAKWQIYVNSWGGSTFFSNLKYDLKKKIQSN